MYFVVRTRQNDNANEVGGLAPKRGLNKSCTLTELAEHLIQNKLGSNAMYFSLSSREVVPFGNLKNGVVPSAFIDGVPGSTQITIFECDDELAAKHGARQCRQLVMSKRDKAGDELLQKMVENTVFSWGRFGFLVKDVVLGKRIKVLLGIE